MNNREANVWAAACAAALTKEHEAHGPAMAAENAAKYADAAVAEFRRREEQGFWFLREEPSPVHGVAHPPGTPCMCTCADDGVMCVREPTCPVHGGHR